MSSSYSSSNPGPPPGWLVELGWADRYSVMEVIGSGGMGQVWRALDHETSRLVALKVIHPARSGDEHLLARLESEATALLRLRDAGQHEHIVPILDFKLTDTHACLVMEYIPGQDLKKWCDMHRLDLRKRVALLAKAARAAGWCHQHGIIHRDLKPANILVHSASGEPVVVDFSIAKTDEPLALTLTNEALGTAPYMAPEQLDRSRGTAVAATDVYALGATLYELITHTPPHPGDLAQIIKRHQNEDRPARPSLLNKEVPGDLESIVLKALAYRPSDRYADGAALAADLERFLAGQPVQARPLSTLSYMVRQALRRPALSAAVAACLLISVIALASLRSAAHERMLHELAARLTTAMQGKSWSRAALQQADVTLSTLVVKDAASTAMLRESLIEDVINDVETALRLPYLKPEDITWMRGEATAWLSAKNPPQAARLQSLITERLGRWETLASVQPPFNDLAGLFAGSKMRVQGDLLFLDYEGNSKLDPKDYAATISVKEDLTTPAQVAITFVADPMTFKRVGMGFEFQKVRTDILLFSVHDAPDSVLKTFEGQELNPKGFILYTARLKRMDRTLYISDTDLLRGPFKITVRSEHNHLNVDVNGQWSLPMDDLFVAATTAAKNSFSISWPRDLGLRELIIRTRPAGVSNPLERGDLFFAQEKWPEAQRIYEAMKGDPTFGLEASYKAALAQWQQNQTEAALAIWEPISNGPPGLWRDLSSYRLWINAAIRQGSSAARPYLLRLPEASTLSPAIKSIITFSDRKQINNIYRTAGLGMNGLRNNVTEINEAVKALQIVGTAPVELASKFAMALHTCGLDDAARQLLGDGLGSPEKNLKDTTEQYSARLALDQWTLITRSETDQTLKQRLNAWRKTFPNDATLQAIGDQEDSRVQARAGDYPSALKRLRKVHERSGVDPRQLISAWLLEGMIQRLLGYEEEAQKAWQQGIEVATDVSQCSALHLCDLIILHSLAKTWNREAVTQVITQLMGKGKTGSASLALQSAFVSSFLANDEFVRSLNTIADQPKSHDLAQHYALRSKTARELTRAWYAVIMERYFLSAAFPPDVSSADQARVQSTVEHLVEAVAASQGDEQIFFTYIQAWTSPWLSNAYRGAKQPYPAPLVVRLKWLLAQRYIATGYTKEARGLLEEIKDERSLDVQWRADIAAFLTSP